MMTSQEIQSHHRLLNPPQQKKPLEVNIKSNLIRPPQVPTPNNRFRIAKPSAENQNNYSCKLQRQAELQRAGSAVRSDEYHLEEGMTAIDLIKRQRQMQYHQKTLEAKETAKPFQFLANLGGNNSNWASLTLKTNTIIEQKFEEPILDQPLKEQTRHVRAPTMVQVQNSRSRAKLVMQSSGSYNKLPLINSSGSLALSNPQLIKTEIFSELDIGNEVVTFAKTILEVQPTQIKEFDQKLGQDLPYPDLFDRSERTIAATFAKYGDLTYFTPTQRIGSYMEFSSRLKRRHLADLIAFMKSSQAQKAQNPDEDTIEQSTAQFLESCLFHGFMPNESVAIKNPEKHLPSPIPEVTNVYNNPKRKALVEPAPKQILAYDPLSSWKDHNMQVEKIWSPTLIAQIKISINRFLHYINGNFIKDSEFSQIKKEWMQNALNLVPEHLLSSFQQLVRALFSEIFQGYAVAVKFAILSYIVRSPDERKRLHIIMLPFECITSAERQAYNGGYSTMKHRGTHTRKRAALQNIRQTLLNNNIVASQLQAWFSEFRDFSTVNFQNLGTVLRARNALQGLSAQGSLQYAVDPDTFFAFQEAHLEKTLSLFKHIWYRGAVLIARKFKYLKLKGTPAVKGSRWNYEGPDKEVQAAKTAKSGGKQPLNSEEEVLISSQRNHDEKLAQYNYGTAVSYQNVPLKMFRLQKGFLLDSVPQFKEDLLESISLEDLQDIRENPAYVAYLTKQGGKLNLEEDGYKSLAKDQRSNLKFVAGNMMSLQLRQTVMRSVQDLVDYFSGFPTFESLSKRKNLEPLRDMQPMMTSFTDQSIDLVTGVKTKSAKNQSLLIQNLQFLNDKSFDTDVGSPKLILPEFISLQDFCNPILHLELILGCRKTQEAQEVNTLLTQLCDLVLFNKTDDQILQDCEYYFNSLVTCFNNFLRPEFVKIKQLTQKKYDAEFDDSEMIRLTSTTDDPQRYFQSKTLRQNQNQQVIQALKNGIYPSEFASRVNPAALEFDKQIYSNNFQWSGAYQRYAGRLQLRESSESVTQKQIQLGVYEDPRMHTLQRHLQIADPTEEVFKQKKREFMTVIREHLHEVKQVTRVLDQFKCLIGKELKEKVDLFCELTPETADSLNSFDAHLSELNYYHQLAMQLPERVAFPMFEVGLCQMKTELKQRIESLQKQLLQVLEKDLLNQSKAIILTFEGFRNYLKRDLKNSQDVVSMLNFKGTMVQEMVSLRQTIDIQQKCLYFLLTHNYSPDIFKEPSEEQGHHDSNSCFSAVMTAFHWPNLINDIIHTSDDRHSQQRKFIEDDVIGRRATLDESLAKVQLKLNKVYGWKEFRTYKVQTKEVQLIQLEVNQLAEMSEVVVREEYQMFGIRGNQQAMAAIRDKFEPHNEMWTAINHFMKKEQSYMAKQIDEIDADDVDQLLEETRFKLIKLQKNFEYSINSLTILTVFEKEIERLQHVQPLIQALCNKSLKDHHWKKIKETLGGEIEIKKMTLKAAVDLEIEGAIDQLAAISEKAKRQFQLEQNLSKMQTFWQVQTFRLISMKNQKDIMIFSNEQIVDLQDVVDEHVIIAQSVTNNPDVQPIIDLALEWQRMMYFMQEILELLAEVQGSFIYLWPVFNQFGVSDEVRISLNYDGFRLIDQAWRFILAQVEADPCVLNLKKIPNIQEQFDQMVRDLDLMKRSLSIYLESKRMVFPRLYFLSDTDLIQLLGESRDPQLISKTICKSFDGIGNLEFRETERFKIIQLEIFQMESRQGEKVELSTTIFPSQYDFNIDQWMVQLEKQMRLTMQKVITSGISAYPQDIQKLGSWMKTWPCQVVLLTEQVIWTQRIEQCFSGKMAIKGLQPFLLQTFLREQQELLDLIISMIQQPIPVLLRLTLQNLIIVKVHAKDTLAELIAERTDNAEHFTWFSQLRLYHDGENTVNVSMISAKLEYQFEYIGVAQRLVITPLTDRCYRTLMSAIVCNLGGAPEGPAGTGKSETIKDLARQVALPCVVFNGQDGIYSKTMARFFKGLSQSGCWSCFDEFDRIDIEVLSVVAQQVREIQNAKSLGVSEYMFEEELIKIRCTCNIFITMNQTYVGRIPLPDNLKSLFRPVAMVLPDYTRIIEISLYSIGFTNSRDLAKKVVATFMLCNEQCSAQCHYDFGLRAHKAVLDSAHMKKIELSSTQLKFKLDLADEEQLILQSIVAINLPKFVTSDIPNFMGIVQDLFPLFEPQKSDGSHLEEYLKDACKKLNLQPKDSFVRMGSQINGMLAVKQGIVIIGPALRGKTSIIRTLQAAIEDKEQALVEIFRVNPKSISLSQLFGKFDYISQEFSDGVLGNVFRRCASSASFRQWVVLDGPIEATWVENMNTVLDENRKLCLLNGETISVTKTMNVIFETDDLSMTSPATVSRTGIIYMSEDITGGWKSLLSSWFSTFESEAKLSNVKATSVEEILHRMTCLVKFLFLAIFKDCTRKLKFMIQVTESQLFSSLLKFMQIITITPEFIHKIHLGVSSVNESDIFQRLEINFIHSLNMSIGTLIDDVGQETFSEIVREHSNQSYKATKSDGTSYSFRVFTTAMMPDLNHQSASTFYVENGHWCSWAQQIQKLDHIDAYPWLHETTFSFYDIIVPTIESLKQNYVMKLFLESGNHLLIVGLTGTGKSIAGLHQVLNLNQEKYQGTSVSFSAKSTASSLQEYIEGQLQKQSGKKLAPRHGQKLYIFLDDLNMPAYDKARCQPPIELLRQWMDYGEWYDVKNKDLRLRSIEDLIFSGTMKPDISDQIQVSKRFIRHFNIVGCTPDDKAVHRIFSKIMDWHIRLHKLSSSKISTTLRDLVGASIEVLKFAQIHLKPTPAKCHYQWNLRDISRVILGMQLMTKIDATTSINKILRLWVHEVGRVFSDRLIDNFDTQKLFEMLPATVKQFAKEDLEKAFWELNKHDSRIKNPITTPETMTKHIQFTYFAEETADKKNDDAPKGSEQIYNEVLTFQDREKLTVNLDKMLLNYNMISKKPLDIVLFEYAQLHLLRIHRVLKMSRGNSLLIGLGGSGRQSLTALAAYSCNQNFVQLEISQDYSVEMWNDDLKRVTMMAGCDEKPSVLLLNEIHLHTGFMLEDINSLLNTGHVHNLFQGDDFLVIREKLREYFKRDGNQEMVKNGTIQQFYQIFCRRVMKNLHIALAMRPDYRILSERIRGFPALVGCCSVNYFQPWPEEALAVVANKFIQEGPNLTQEQKDQLVRVIAKVHQEVHTLSSVYQKETNTKIYVTLTMFLDMISLFKQLLSRESKKLIGRRDELDIGLQKLEIAVGSVTLLQEDLEFKTPQLEDLKREIAVTVEEMERERVSVVEPKKKEVYREEMGLNELSLKAEELEHTCQNELRRAEPILEAAAEALSTIMQHQINEIKQMMKPPVSVKLVMQAICILMQRPAEKTPNPENPKQLVENWWYTSQKFLNEKDFIKMLQDFDKNNIDETIMHRVKEEFLSDPELRPARVEKASFAAKGLAEWLFNIEKFDQLTKFVQPKRAAHADAVFSHQCRVDEVRIKQDELRSVVYHYESLVQRLEEETERLKKLEDEIVECKLKLRRAKIIIRSLGGLIGNWQELLVKQQKKITTLVSDNFLGAAMMTHLGPYPKPFRDCCVRMWLQYLTEVEMPTSDFNLADIFADSITRRRWELDGLSTDQQSLENAVIVKNYTQKWHLFMDPQNQGNRWVNQTYAVQALERHSTNNLIVIRPDSLDFRIKLEQAIRMGLPVMIENNSENIEPFLFPILKKQFYTVSKNNFQIKLGENYIEYNQNFSLVMTSKQEQPHFEAEMFTMLTVINFMISFDGLKEQLLNLVVKRENDKLYRQNRELNAAMIVSKQQVKDIEDSIFKVLFESKQNVLDDEQAVQVLEQSSNIQSQILAKEKEEAEAEAILLKSRQVYSTFTAHSALLFLIVQKLKHIQPIYQYSLTWFLKFFDSAIANSREVTIAESKRMADILVHHSSMSQDHIEAGATNKVSESVKSMQIRVEILVNFFTFHFYSQISRSLFQKHKLVFTFILTAKLKQFSGLISHMQYDVLIQQHGGFENPLQMENPCPSWLPQILWNKLCILASNDSHHFGRMIQDFEADQEIWRQIYDSTDHHAEEQWPLSQNMSLFSKICVLKILRPDKLIKFMNLFINHEMGPNFKNVPEFNLRSSYDESNPETPLMFLLPGVDPMIELERFAKQKKKAETMRVCSLGQGQDKSAEHLLQEARKYGFWLVLQNCHLYPSWMPKLEQIIDEVQSKITFTHPHFRLWLTTRYSKSVPTSVIQNSIKMTDEPQESLRHHMHQQYNSQLLIKEVFTEKSPQPAVFKKLVYGLTMFHSTMLQRQMFGKNGWNADYNFTSSDFTIGLQQLSIFLTDFKKVPYDALMYLIGECNYGGRVTENLDRRMLRTFIEDFISPKILEKDYQPISGFVGRPYAFPHGDLVHQAYLDTISEMPEFEDPQIFGFNSNASINRLTDQAGSLIKNLLRVGEIEGARKLKGTSLIVRLTEETSGDRSIFASVSEIRQIEMICQDLIKVLPSQGFDENLVSELFPFNHKRCLNSFLVQEVSRFNCLYHQIMKNTKELSKVVIGETLYTDILLQIKDSLLINVIPQGWLDLSYPSVKPLAGFVKDLCLRMEQIQQWISKMQQPEVFWLPGFFFTQGFLTSVKQTYARLYQYEIQQVQFKTHFMNEMDHHNYQEEVFDIVKAEKQGFKLEIPSNGVLITGLFFECASWDYELGYLIEQPLRQLYSKVPFLWLQPVKIEEDLIVDTTPNPDQVKEVEKVKQTYYSCPLYKTTLRQSTNESKNFVTFIETPLIPQFNPYGPFSQTTPTHWIKRGTAMILQLPY